MATAGEMLVRLLSGWNEADAEARASILSEVLSDGFRYEDPHAPEPFEGAEGMAQYLGVFRENLPDAVLLPMGSPQVTHDTAMILARLDRGGEPFARLRFVGAAGEGGLARVTGFVESE
jgi:hypothetical protein